MESISINHLTSLLLMSPMVIYTSRPSGDFAATSISANVTTQLGYQPSDFLDEASFWADHIHPDDREKTISGLAALFEEGHHEHDYRFLHKDGSYRWMNDQLVLRRDDDGTPVEIVGYWSDVTERTLLEQALRESEQRFELAITGADGGLWDKNYRAGTEYWAPRFYELIGYRDGEIEPSNAMFESLLHPDDREHVRRATSDHLEHRSANYESRYRMRTKSGEYRWFRSRAHALWDEADTPARLVGFITDVTERMQAEQALRESDLRFNLAVTGANEGLWDKNLLTGVEYWSPRFYALLGYADDEIPSSDDAFLQLLHPADVPRVRRAVDDHVEHRTPYEIEYRLLTKSGEYRWFRSRARAVWDESGTPVRMVGFIADITEQRALRASLTETQQILDSTPDPTLIVNARNQIVFSNSKAEAFGYTREELRRRPITTILPGILHTEPGPDPASGVELRGRRKDGSGFPVEVSRSPIDAKSGDLVAIAIRDISDRRLAEQRQRTLEAQLQQAQKLESLGMLAGGIAHDFNNLLMGVLGNAELALAKLPPESAAREELHSVVAASIRAAELTKQMLAYSGKGKFVVEALDLSRLVEEIGHLLTVSISKNVVLKYDFDDHLPAIEADASQIQQIIMNLIINASEAIGEANGVVTITTSAVDLDRSSLRQTYLDEDLPPGRYVCLEVTDTGVGMDAETHQRIFDPFFTTKFTGRGLGLAAVLGIIRGHGGTLRIDSEPGVGTSFTVMFPAVEMPTKQAVSAASQHGTWHGRGIVLVVDDEEPVRLAAKNMIESQGFDVLTAEDGIEAVDVFRQHSADIVAVLLDLTMPRMGGDEAFRELRRVSPDVPVILSSGFNEQETSSQFADGGLSAFIQKPYGLDALVGKLREAVGA